MAWGYLASRIWAAFRVGVPFPVSFFHRGPSLERPRSADCRGYGASWAVSTERLNPYFCWPTNCYKGKVARLEFFTAHLVCDVKTRMNFYQFSVVVKSHLTLIVFREDRLFRRVDAPILV